MSRYIDIETIKPRQYENSEVELGVLAYDYDEVNAMPFLDIVECKECKKANTEDCSTSWYDDDWGVWRIGYMGDNWYCADGARAKFYQE